MNSPLTVTKSRRQKDAAWDLPKEAPPTNVTLKKNGNTDTLLPTADTKKQQHLMGQQPPVPGMPPTLEQDHWDPLSEQALLTNFGVEKLAPSLSAKDLESMDALQTLNGVNTGVFHAEVNLKEGDHELGGHTVHINAGTRVTVDAVVKDGQLVPAQDEHGNAVPGGTRVTIIPPINAALWVTAQGAYVEAKDAKHGDVVAQLGGFPDWIHSDVSSLRPGDMVKSLLGEPVKTTPGPAPSGASGLASWVDPHSMQYSLKDVTMQGAVDTGVAKVGFGPGNRLTLSGDANRAVLSGAVDLHNVALKAGPLSLEGGQGKAELTATYVRSKDGTLTVDTHFSGVTGQLEHLESQQEVDGQTNRVALGQVSVTNASAGAKATFVPDAGGAPQLKKVEATAHVEAQGTFLGAKMHTQYGTYLGASSRPGAGVRAHINGTLDISPAGTKLDAKIDNTEIRIGSLNSEHAGSQINLKSATLGGDATFKMDTGKRTFDLKVNAKEVDVKLQRYHGSGSGVDVDVGETTLKSVKGPSKDPAAKGAGNSVLARFNQEGQLNIDGPLRLSGKMNGIGVDGDPGHGKMFELNKDSTVDATVTHFSGGPDPFEMDAKGTITAGGKINFEKNGVALTGTLSGKMPTSFSFDKRGDFTFSPLPGAVEAQMTVTADSATLMGIHAEKGSTAQVTLRELDFIGSDVTYKLGPSEVQVKLAPGTLRVGGKDVKVEEGSTAQIHVESAEGGLGTITHLKATAGVALNVGSRENFDVGGVKVVPKNGAQGDVYFQADLNMNAQQALKWSNVNATVDVQTGAAPTGPPREPQKLGKMVSPNGVIPAAQVAGAHDSASLVTAPAGGATPDKAKPAFDPIQVAKRIQNGTLEMTIPLPAGPLDKEHSYVKLAPGSVLTFRARVKDGNLVDSETVATLSPPAQLPLGFKLKGVSLTSGRYPDGKTRPMMLPTLTVGTPWDMGDVKITGPFGGIPATGLSKQVDQLVDQVALLGAPKDSANPLPLGQASFNIQGASLKPGVMPIPGGQMDVAPGSAFSIQGTALHSALSGHLAFTGMETVQDGVAFKTGKGETDLAVKLDAQPDGDGYKANVLTQMHNLNVETEYAVERGENRSDYVVLGKGSAQGGDWWSTTEGSWHPKTGFGPIQTTKVSLTLPKFNGALNGGRVTVPDAEGTATWEFGPTQVTQGSVKVTPYGVELLGTFDKLDAVVRDYAVDIKPSKPGEGPRDAFSLAGMGKPKPGKANKAEPGFLAGAVVDYGHLVARNGKFKVTSQGVDLKGTVDNVDLRASNLHAQGTKQNQKYDLSASQLNLTGHGTMEVSHTGAFSLTQGDVYLEVIPPGGVAVDKGVHASGVKSAASGHIKEVRFSPGKNDNTPGILSVDGELFVNATAKSVDIR